METCSQASYNNTRLDIYISGYALNQAVAPYPIPSLHLLLERMENSTLCRLFNCKKMNRKINNSITTTHIRWCLFVLLFNQSYFYCNCFILSWATLCNLNPSMPCMVNIIFGQKFIQSHACFTAQSFLLDSLLARIVALHHRPNWYHQRMVWIIFQNAEEPITITMPCCKLTQLPTEIEIIIRLVGRRC